MVKSLAGYEAVLSIHKPLWNLVEEYRTVAWNWASCSSEPAEWETTFLPSSRKGRRAGDVPVHVLSSPAWKEGGVQERSSYEQNSPT